MKELTLEWLANGIRQVRSITSEKEIVIGRHPNCDIVLGDRYVSRRHAAVISRNGRLLVRVLSHTNPVFFSGIVGHHEWTSTLRPGDAFRVGHVYFAVGNAQANEGITEPASATSGKCRSCGSDLGDRFSICEQCGTSPGGEYTLLEPGTGATVSSKRLSQVSPSVRR